MSGRRAGAPEVYAEVAARLEKASSGDADWLKRELGRLQRPGGAP